MIGIPIKVRVNGQEEVCFLSTRRSGDAGEHMKHARRKFHEARHASARAYTRQVTIAGRAENLDPSRATYVEELERLEAEQNKTLEAGLAKKFEAEEWAEKYVRLAFAENHGREMAERILDELTPADLTALIEIAESGEAPEDFFPRRVIQPKPNSILPPEESSGESSSSQDSREPTSSPEE